MKLAVLILSALTAAIAADKATAKRLLDSISESASAATPETAVAAAWRAAEAYAAIDKTKSTALLQDAFTAASALNTHAEPYRVGIAESMVAVDLKAAAQLLPQLKEPASAAEKIVTQLAGKGDFEDAIAILSLTPTTAEYPFNAAARLIHKLPAEDPRRQIAFGRAIEAFRNRPSGPFPALVERYSAAMPAEMKTSAAAALSAAIDNWKDDTSSFSGTASEGTPELHSPKQLELRECFSVLQMLDPNRAKAILGSRPEVRTALDGFKQKRKPAEPYKDDANKKDDDDDENMLMAPLLSMSSAPDMNNFMELMQSIDALSHKATEVTKVMEKDPNKALSMARQLPQTVRGEMLSRIALSTSNKDVAFAQSVIDSVMLEITSLKKPGERIPVYVTLAEAFHKLGNDDRAAEAFSSAIQDLPALYADDDNAKRPNTAMRDVWPSVQATRIVFDKIARTLPAQTETLLANLVQADLNLLARAQAGRSLLDLPFEMHQINVSWSSPPV